MNKKRTWKKWFSIFCTVVLLMTGLASKHIFPWESIVEAQEREDSSAKLMRVTLAGESEVENGAVYKGGIVIVYVSANADYKLEMQKSVQDQADEFATYTSSDQGKKPLLLNVGARQATYQFVLTCGDECKHYMFYINGNGQSQEGTEEPAVTAEPELSYEIKGENAGEGYVSGVTVEAPKGADVKVTGDAASAAVTEKEGSVAISQMYSDETYNVTIEKDGVKKESIIVVLGKDITADEELTLKAGKIYHLGKGSWRLQGEDITYTGSQTFSIVEDGKYIFIAEE